MRADFIAIRQPNAMDDEARQEEIAAMVGTLSALDLQLQRVEETALTRANVFLEEANQDDPVASPQFNTIGHLLQEICSDVHEVREYIDRLEAFLREGHCEEWSDETTSKTERGMDLDGRRFPERAS